MLRFLGMCLCIVVGFAAASRLQVNEGVRFVTRNGEVIEGTVSRDFLTGDYVIKTADRTERHIQREQFGAMAMAKGGLSLGSIVAAIFGIVLGGLIGFGVKLPKRGIS